MKKPTVGSLSCFRSCQDLSYSRLCYSKQWRFKWTVGVYKSCEYLPHNIFKKVTLIATYLVLQSLLETEFSMCVLEFFWRYHKNPQENSNFLVGFMHSQKNSNFLVGLCATHWEIAPSRVRWRTQVWFIFFFWI